MTEQSQEPITTANLLRRMHTGWEDLQAFLARFTDAQLSQPVDEVGWRAQDHLMHIAVWANGITALLKRQPRWAGMGIEKKVWKELSIDDLNEALYLNNKALSLTEVRQKLHEAHHNLYAAVAALSDEDLLRSYSYYAPDDRSGNSEEAILGWIVGDSFSHYVEHQPWIEAIAAQG